MFKRNDKVRIKGDLSNHFDYVPDMEKFLGKVVTVTRVLDDGYSIKEDYGEWIWYDDMVEEVI